MMSKNIFLAPAKLNIFLKVIGRRKDGYHEIRTGITFINLFDKIEIEEDNEFNISYSGNFKPENGKYNDCIIKKTLDFLNIREKLKLRINITKNIPVRGGLGSASTNAATMIIALEKMNIIDIKKPEYYSFLGADIPSFLFKRDCLVAGMGDKIQFHLFPKYFFLLVQPNFNNSTKDMYDQLNFKKIMNNQELLSERIEINEDDSGNDFESIMVNNEFEYSKIINYLENLDYAIFARMTGSGSCCYAAFEKKEYALEAKKSFTSKFSDLWSTICENNNINI